MPTLNFQHLQKSSFQHDENNIAELAQKTRLPFFIAFFFAILKILLEKQIKLGVIIPDEAQKLFKPSFRSTDFLNLPKSPSNLPYFSPQT